MIDDKDLNIKIGKQQEDLQKIKVKLSVLGVLGNLS